MCGKISASMSEQTGWNVSKTMAEGKSHRLAKILLLLATEIWNELFENKASWLSVATYPRIVPGHIFAWMIIPTVRMAVDDQHSEIIREQQLLKRALTIAAAVSNDISDTLLSKLTGDLRYHAWRIPLVSAAVLGLLWYHVDYEKGLIWLAMIIVINTNRIHLKGNFISSGGKRSDRLKVRSSRRWERSFSTFYIKI